MQWNSAVGLEKNITENRQRTEKPITEAPLITILIERQDKLPNNVI